MSWNLKVLPLYRYETKYFEEAGLKSLLGEFEDVVIERGKNGGARSSLANFMVGKLVAWSKLEDGNLKERVGILACDYNNSLEFNPNGTVVIDGNPVVIGPPHAEDPIQRNVLHLEESLEVRWELTPTGLSVPIPELGTIAAQDQ